MEFNPLIAAPRGHGGTMNHPAVTSIAGRHEADVRRARLAGHNHRQQDAREDLERTIRRRGLQVVADWHGTAEPALAVKCRLEHAQDDRIWIYAALDSCGWQPDRTRLSRINARYDVLRLRHKDTAAPLMLVITNACGEVEAWEVA
jgi:hypothetical protein